MYPARLWVYLEEILAGTFMVLMSVATVAGVIARYCFNNPLPWTEEFARYTFIWLIFLGAVVCTKQNAHIVVDSLVVLMPGRLRQVVSVIVDGLVLVLVLILLYYGWRVTASATQPTSTLQVPQSVVYAALPVSAALIALRMFKTIWQKMQVCIGEGAA